MPAAEVEISPSLVLRLLAEQHPDLVGLPLELVANGWDNAIFRLSSDFAVRLPRRQAAAELIRNEQRWLPELSRGLAIATPVPVRTGVPSSYFPWNWSITPWLKGIPAIEVPPAGRSAAAEDLAEFVLSIHRPAPADAPRNPVRGGKLSSRSGAVEERLAAAALPSDLLALWRELCSIPEWQGPPMWLHGDLHAGNLLLTGHGHLAAVLDFGDLASGDPATDLAAAWMVFDRGGRGKFMDRINRERRTDAETWQRARGWALCMGSALAAMSDDHPAFRSMGLAVLSEVLTDDGRTA
ncbi:phosphotransferase [Arthrobacter sp. JZ12]|uniref:aminoglycoside phosphotransferase family protein n=1 Tax=Arthrobacter sp. JZ12 TaxID=2654190 RepID=UPI002B48D93B|nr:aminoglycoside phosphotransferase family protein [Arthrobacter sp. JZ12]WRH26406.1 phosphotransferase [Arthrobacter sp. JZ12]